MQRCLDLAVLGAGSVAPNPMVGAVLVYKDQIIGEGWHQKFGKPHAEVNCINQAIANGHSEKISRSVLYVSLEPCSHFGKTPPCTDLIIEKKISEVVIGCRDPFKEVDGKGAEKLKNAGVKVEMGLMEKECKELNRRFFTFHTNHRPYIILKWAQTGDRYIASAQTYSPANSRLQISNEYSNRLIHKWRSEEAAILVGTNTALMDDPDLRTRLWPGHSPVRLVIDMELKLPVSLRLFNRQQRTIVFNKIRHEEQDGLFYYKVGTYATLVHQVLNALYQLKIQSVMVEGGAQLLQSFIGEGLWDEARVITNSGLLVSNGLQAPQLQNAEKTGEFFMISDHIEISRPVMAES